MTNKIILILIVIIVGLTYTITLERAKHEAEMRPNCLTTDQWAEISPVLMRQYPTQESIDELQGSNLKIINSLRITR